SSAPGGSTRRSCIMSRASWHGSPILRANRITPIGGKARNRTASSGVSTCPEMPTMAALAVGPLPVGVPRGVPAGVPVGVLVGALMIAALIGGPDCWTWGSADRSEVGDRAAAALGAYLIAEGAGLGHIAKSAGSHPPIGAPVTFGLREARLTAAEQVGHALKQKLPFRFRGILRRQGRKLDRGALAVCGGVLLGRGGGWQ